MAMGMSELKKGLKIELDGIPYKIIEYAHVKPGKGAAFVRCKIKNYLNGKTIEKTFHAGDKFDTPNLQIGLSYEQVGENINWIIDGANVDMMFFNNKPITVEVPNCVTMKVEQTPPNFKGDSQGGKKPATLECGAVVQVPFHIVEGDIIKCDTRTGEYLEKVKK